VRQSLKQLSALLRDECLNLKSEQLLDAPSGVDPICSSACGRCQALRRSTGSMMRALMLLESFARLVFWWRHDGFLTQHHQQGAASAMGRRMTAGEVDELLDIRDESRGAQP